MLFLAQHLWNFSDAPAKRRKTCEKRKFSVFFLLSPLTPKCSDNALSDRSYETPSNFSLNCLVFYLPNWEPEKDSCLLWIHAKHKQGPSASTKNKTPNAKDIPATVPCGCSTIECSPNCCECFSKEAWQIGNEKRTLKFGVTSNTEHIHWLSMRRCVHGLCTLPAAADSSSRELNKYSELQAYV